MNVKLGKVESELLSTAVERIVTGEVLEKTLSDRLPLTAELTDANKVLTGKVSMLFVDMRESTKLPDMFTGEQLVKIYRSYIRVIVQAVRYSGGYVRDFMGDGVLAVFQDNEEGCAEDKAVLAARYITTAVDKYLNPVLDKQLKHRISCGIGIHTGDVTLSKVGMKGKEQDDTAENEYGIAWIGNSTNLACKFSNAVECGDIFISTSTYSALTDLEEKQAHWNYVEREKGPHILAGYLAEKYYLETECDSEAIGAERIGDKLGLVDHLKNVLEAQTAELAHQIKVLEEKELEIKECEEVLGNRERALKEREERLNKQILSHKKDEYDFYCNVIEGAHCKRDYVIAMGEDFWEQALDDAIVAGAAMGKNRKQVRQRIAYALVSVYCYIEAWDKAYDALIDQATGGSWLSLYKVQQIISKLKHSSIRLRNAIKDRLYELDVGSSTYDEFLQISNWLSKS